MSQPSIVFCAGAWHTGIQVQPVLPHFQDAGYAVRTQTLRSAGAEEGIFEDDFSAIQSTLSSELQKGHDVCLILHSLSGISGCEAVNRILDEKRSHEEGRLIRIIFLASFTDAREVREHPLKEGYFLVDVEAGVTYVAKTESAFYNDMSLEDSKPFREALTWQATYTTPPKFSSERWKELPLTYIICTQDNTVLPSIQERIAQDYGMEVERIEAGHCPFTSQPERLVQVVDRLLKS